MASFPNVTSLAIAAGKDLDSTTAADLDSRRVVTCTPETTVHRRGAHDGELRAALL